MENENIGTDTKVKLENTGVIDLPKFDLTPYIGRESKIEFVEEHEGQYGYYVKLLSESLGTRMHEGKEVEIRASKVLGLQIDAEKKIGWGPKTNMSRYLAKMKVEHYNELQNMKIFIQTTTSKKDGNEYLTF